MAEETTEQTGNEEMVDGALEVVRDVVGKDFDVDYEEEAVEEASGGSSVEEAMGGEQSSRPPAESEETGKPSQKLAAEAYRERAQKRAQLQDERDRYQRELESSQRQTEDLKGYLNVLLRRMAQQGPSAQPEEQAEPEFPNVDPEVRDLIRHEMERVQSGFKETVQPFLQDREQAEQTRQQQEQMAQKQAAWQGYLQQLDAEEHEYRQSELGDGYDDRLNGYRERFRGMLQDLGQQFPHINDQVIEQLEQANLMGMTQLARSLRVPVPYFADAYLRAFGIGGTNGAAPAQQPRRPASADLSAARQAVEDGVGTGRRGHGSPPTDDLLDVDLLLEKGLSPKALDQMIEQGGDWAGDLVRLAEEAERRLG